MIKRPDADIIIDNTNDLNDDMVKALKKAYDEVVKMMSKKHKTEYITVDSIKEISI